MGTFYLGRIGRLIALPVPDANIARPEERVGGTHVSLDGTKTVDSFGHKRSWELTFEWRYRSEMSRLRALHRRSVSGPLRLIDPMIPNRLAVDVSTCGAAPRKRILPLIGDGNALRNSDGPTALVDLCDGCIEWTPPAGVGLLTERVVSRAAVIIPGETVTLSCYVKSVAGRSAQVQLRVFNSAGTQIALVSGGSTTSSTWSRLQVSRTAAGTDAYAVAELSAAAGSGAVRTTGWQLEEGSSPTSWDIGGGSPRVVLDQVSETSPYFPMTDAGLTLMEV